MIRREQTFPTDRGTRTGRPLSERLPQCALTGFPRKNLPETSCFFPGKSV